MLAATVCGDGVAIGVEVAGTADVNVAGNDADGTEKGVVSSNEIGEFGVEALAAESAETFLAGDKDLAEAGTEVPAN